MKLKKDITFIYKKKSQIELYEPIIFEAKKRNYITKLTTNKKEKCEIGFYCEHFNSPQFSKYSIIMLHDLLHENNNSVNFWYSEPWNKYDIGLIPNKEWEIAWKKSSCFFYVRPRVGVYNVGWPKADIISEFDIYRMKDDYEKKIGINFKKKTILYVPSYENDRKQDDFVKAMQKLDVNMLIKHGVINSDSILNRQMISSIEEMKKEHSNLPNIYILEPSTNVMHAIAVSDIIVSEESGCMAEAVLMGKPVVSVDDWLIPLNPPRLPSNNYPFLIRTNKADLTECVRKILNSYELYEKKAKEYSSYNYKNIGCSAKNIMDIIDSVINNSESSYPKVDSDTPIKMKIEDLFKYEYSLLKRKIANHYVYGSDINRNKIITWLAKEYLKIRTNRKNKV